MMMTMMMNRKTITCCYLEQMYRDEETRTAGLSDLSLSSSMSGLSVTQWTRTSSTE